jgi:glycosyltransferase-like protein
MTKGPRIAILTHSTNPRGGVVHALELGDALTRLGYQATVFAPDATRSGFFRRTLCATSSVPASPVCRDVRAMVETRVADYLHYFASPGNRSFDIWHAQDSISGNALATLKERGLIPSFARTVHHVDAFDDERLVGLQQRAIIAADQLFVVGHLWRDWLVGTLKRDACYVGNGVDRNRFSPTPDETDTELRAKLGLPHVTPVFLALGGVEERKNTIHLLQAFQTVRLRHPASRLVIAGGASLLDHGAYQARFVGMLAHAGGTATAVIRIGPLRQRLMPALYRAATSLVCPSIKEGFGLVVLEAMASGIPAIASNIPPFTEYLGKDDVLWCDPHDAASIAAAMTHSLNVRRRAPLVERGMQVAKRHDWITVARAHLACYARLREPVHA